MDINLVDIVDDVRWVHFVLAANLKIGSFFTEIIF